MKNLCSCGCNIKRAPRRNLTVAKRVRQMQRGHLEMTFQTRPFAFLLMDKTAFFAPLATYLHHLIVLVLR